ncbi:MAG: preprotein translocase subunit SecE [Clostridiales bacterium]|nr:preprotein translocase subunit SecE [Clostridiales bacterium]
MEEELKTTNPNVKNETKKSAPKKSSKKSDKPGLSQKLADCRAEAKKIIWPNRETIRKNTITVIITSLLVGAIIFGMDTVYTTVLNLFIGLLA